MKRLIPLALALLATGLSPAQDEDSSKLSKTELGERVFALHVREILQEKCFACHGGDQEKIKGEFDLTSREAFLKGGETSSEVLVPGKADHSLLMDAILWSDPDYEMPPKENDRLTESQIQKVKNWINWGAPWPDAATEEKWLAQERSKRVTEEGTLWDTSGGQSDAWTFRRYQQDEMWSFAELRKKIPVPDQGETNPVDNFLAAQRGGVEAAPAADGRSLLRRATLDLTGLPPTPEETKTFLAAYEQDEDKAWTALIDRLLESPRYGERQAQHWLDVVRYADTGGFSNDYERSNAWRYRDYVIRSFNDDKPYADFVVEQLAGDELKPGDPEMTVAVGMLRMGQWGTAMVEQPVARQLFLDDVVHGVGQTFLGTAMRCAKCHDHKFDPLPTKDYYRMYATFAATQPAEMKADFLEEENRDGFEKNKEIVDRLLTTAKGKRTAVNTKMENAARAWYEKNNLPYKNEKERKGDPEDQKPPRHVGLDIAEQGRKKVREQDVWIWERRLERFQPLAQSVYNGKNFYYNTRKLRKDAKNIDPKWRPQTTIFEGGSLEAPGDPVGPGVLSAVGLSAAEAPRKDPFVLTNELEGRRLGFAQWVAHPDNGLALRAVVNRIWLGHFGRGIAGNPNNLGAKGKLPTHPELIDYLARRFQQDGGSFKEMHRLIMTSRAYRMGTKHPQLSDLEKTDPNNETYAYFQPRRLTAEEIRDGMLAITGELNDEMGGLPIMPEINMEVALQPRMIQFSLAPAYLPSRTPDQRNRRSIYAYKVRGQADPFMEVLNAPNPNESCEARESAAVTPQAFTLLNSEVANDRSIAFALRLEKEAANRSARIDRAFQLALGRDPAEAEKKRLLAYLQKMEEYHSGQQPKPVEYPEEITRRLVEEFSGEPFWYIERLAAFEDYTPDKKAADVGPQTRALADLCLLLFNANEFVYVY